MYKQVIVVRKDLNLSSGKLAAQVAHAAVGAYRNCDKDKRETWNSSGSKKVVVEAKNKNEMLDAWNLAKKEGVATFLVKDAGKTEIPSGTITALGLGPDKGEKLDKLTGSMSLK